MNKGIALLLCITVTFVAAQPKEAAAKAGESDDPKAKRMAAVGPKDLDMKKLVGKWFNVASSSAIHKSFIEGGCTCNELEFKTLSDDKLHVIAACQGKDGKINSVKGTLTLVRPKENKSLFRIEFVEKKGDIKDVAVNKTEAETVKKIEKGDDQAKATGKEMVKEDANVIVLKVGKNFEDLVMGSPALDACWILSKLRNFEDKNFEEYKKFLEGNGFSSTKLKRIDHTKCTGDVLKGKASGEPTEKK